MFMLEYCLFYKQIKYQSRTYREIVFKQAMSISSSKKPFFNNDVTARHNNVTHNILTLGKLYMRLYR